MKKRSNEVVIVKDKIGIVLSTIDKEGNDVPIEFPNVQKAMEYLQKTFNRPNLYDDYDYELRPSCKKIPFEELSFEERFIRN
jgi:hypothetical protein